MVASVLGVPERIPPLIRPLLAHTARNLDGCPPPAAKNAAPRRFFYAASNPSEQNAK